MLFYFLRYVFFFLLHVRSRILSYAQNFRSSLKIFPLRSKPLHDRSKFRSYAQNRFIGSILPGKMFIISFSKMKKLPRSLETAPLVEKISRLHLNHLLKFHLILLEHQYLLQIEMMILVHG